MKYNFFFIFPLIFSQLSKQKTKKEKKNTKLTSTVGFPRLSKIWRALTILIVTAIVVRIKFSCFFFFKKKFLGVSVIFWGFFFSRKCNEVKMKMMEWECVSGSGSGIYIYIYRWLHTWLLVRVVNLDRWSWKKKDECMVGMDLCIMRVLF